MMVTEIFRCMFAGADVDVMLFPGFTPLNHAISKGHLSVAKHLIDYKANMEAKTNDGDGNL